MPSSSVKQLLKQARSALDDKDFDAAISLARNVLKADKNSYHAYVFIGVATNAIGDVTRAVQAYQRAVSLRPELPLAYKGLVDTLTASELPEHRLLLARSHTSLGKLSSQHAQVSLPLGADMLYFLALENGALIPEAVEAFADIKAAKELRLSDQKAIELSFRLAKLLIKQISSDNTDKEYGVESALEEAPLSEVLDEVEIFIANGTLPRAYGEVVDAAVQRALSRYLQGDGCERQLSFLRAAHAYEAVLELAETDNYRETASGERFNISMRDFHLRPFIKTPTRARYVLAAELYRKVGNLEVASLVAGVEEVQSSKHAAAKRKKESSSCTQALVNSYLHLIRDEFKLSIEVARAGQQLAAMRSVRSLFTALFRLIVAAALRGDRKYKESVTEFEKARAYAQETGDAWIERACNHGIVDTAVLGHGRRSRQASTAVEEAAGSSENTFGVLECVWADALAGDIDVVRMTQLTEAAVEVAKTESFSGEKLRWETALLDDTFTMSSSEIAAVSKTRLGQMIVQEGGADSEAFIRAQRHQMEAASLFKGRSDPFAQLGYIFEQLSVLKNDDRMSARAIRCYEKALTIDVAHPLASRRLSRMLVARGFVEEAAEVARQTSDRNPKARWAYNVVGWFRVSTGRYNEASVSFRNALRGRPKLSSRAEEALVGTEVGQTEDDNALVIDVDSWRGLSAAYCATGKLGPAMACIEDALTLVRNPALVYTTGIDVNIPAVQEAAELLLRAEMAVLQLAYRRASEAKYSMETLRGGDAAPLTIKYSLSEAYTHLAAEQWLQGCYSRATLLRESAGMLLSEALAEQARKAPHLNAGCMFKRLGDTWMEVATDHPSSLTLLVPGEIVSGALSRAIEAYMKALHVSPWNTKVRVQDLAAALTRMALFLNNEGMSRKAVLMLLASNSVSSVMAMSLLSMASISTDERIQAAASRIARLVSKSRHSKKHTVTLNAAIASLATPATSTNAGLFADSAVAAIRHDPTDWKGWYGVALVREADARAKLWLPELTKSCEEAFREADRLGGGPPAVQGRVRCEIQLLRSTNDDPGDTSDATYLNACFCASLAARAGIEEPLACREVIDKQLVQLRDSREAKLQSLLSQSAEKIYACVHMFPFVREMASINLAVVQ